MRGPRLTIASMLILVGMLGAGMAGLFSPPDSGSRRRRRPWEFSAVTRALSWKDAERGPARDAS